MVFKIQIPQINVNMPTKDLIVTILSSQFPLSLNKIYHQIKKQGHSITYQAVHKSVQELLKDKIITKLNKEYALDEEYIKQIKDFSLRLEFAYKEKKNQILEDLNSNKTVLLNFEKQIDMGRFLFGLLSESQNETIYLVFSFIWCPLTFSKFEYELLKDICSKNNFYLFSNEDTELNRHFAKIWESYGAKVKLGVNSIALFDLILYKDMVIQVFIPDRKETMKRKDLFQKSVKEIDFGIFYNYILEKKFDVPVLIIKNQDLADQLRKKIEELV
ncbi:MAG: hypothetical protein AB1668_03395 [Nanoarchaeota archaeon]